MRFVFSDKRNTSEGHGVGVDNISPWFTTILHLFQSVLGIVGAESLIYLERPWPTRVSRSIIRQRHFPRHYLTTATRLKLDKTFGATEATSLRRMYQVAVVTITC